MILFKYHNQLHFLGFSFLEIHFFLLWVSSVHVYIVVYVLLSYIWRVLLLYAFFRGVSCGQMKHTTYNTVIILVVQENEMPKAALIIVKEIKLCFQDLLNKIIFNVRLQNIINYD